MLKSGVWYMQMRNVTGLLQSSDTWVSVASFIYNPSCAKCPGVRVYHGNTRAEKQKHRAMRIFFFVLHHFNENNWSVFLL